MGAGMIPSGCLCFLDGGRIGSFRVVKVNAQPVHIKEVLKDAFQDILVQPFFILNVAG
jgi:hypothetical protein